MALRILALKVNLVSVGEHPLVTIRSCIANVHCGSLGNRNTVDFGVGSHDSVETLSG